MGDAIRPPLRVLPNPPPKKGRRVREDAGARTGRGARGRRPAALPGKAPPRRMEKGGKVKSKKKSYRGAGCEIRG